VVEGTYAFVPDRRTSPDDRRRERRQSAIATVGHELRTPLTSIRGYIETVLDGDELDAATTRRFLETARREALRLGRLVDGMLEFSMLDLSAGADDARCDIAGEIRATIEAVLPLARRRGVAIRAQLPKAAFACIDGDAFVHAMLNVLENAVKHGRDGGEVTIQCIREDAFLCVVIDDDGPGIAECERETIFAMGARGVAAVHPGNGIGLAIVKAIVTRAGGDVSAEASPVGGARFVLRFPQAS
jgi:two-component system phosphate regulon sensor histidine kinase PhoR